MGEDSDPETGSDAVDDPRDDASNPSGDRTPDADTVDVDSDATTDGDARSRADTDESGTAADGDDSSVAQVDLDAEDSDDADSGDGADDADSDDETDGDSPSEATAVTDPVAVENAPADASDGDASPDESLPTDDDIEPVAEAVPNPGGPDDSPPEAADAADTADAPTAPDPPEPADPPDPNPDATDGPGQEGPAPDEPAPFPEVDDDQFPEAEGHDTAPTADADAGANVHPSHSEAERDLAPVSDDAIDADAEFGDEGYDDAGVVGEGPAEDEEMPLADHIEEMMQRLGVVFLIGGVVLIAAYPASDRVVNFLWNAHIPGAADPGSPRRPRLYGPLELVLTELKVAGLAGFVAGLPALVYQSYRFMRPGLYPKERRYYLASVPTSLVLALVGVAFAHFIVLPAIFAYFTSYTANAEIVVAFGLRETFNLILLLMGYMALVFQIPLFMMLAVMMGLVTRQWMTDKRLLFWGAFLGLSFLVSPDPTGMTPIIVAATMIALFEGTLLLIKWTGR